MSKIKTFLKLNEKKIQTEYVASKNYNSFKIPSGKYCYSAKSPDNTIQYQCDYMDEENDKCLLGFGNLNGVENDICDKTETCKEFCHKLKNKSTNKMTNFKIKINEI